MKKITALLLVLCMVCALTGAAMADKTYTIRIGHSDTTTNLIHVSLEHFAAEVEEKTNGQVKIEIYAAEQLGSTRRCPK